MTTAYQELVRLHRDEGLSFANVRSFNLDEYVGLAPDHPKATVLLDKAAASKLRLRSFYLDIHPRGEDMDLLLGGGHADCISCRKNVRRFGRSAAFRPDRGGRRRSDR